ncbi:MAG: tRNA 2-thiouridine(34) synthase MnmA, partial [Gammaproteobacteria bacterium]|nr:tRNA 2-thiouridine(34) synthase MnmA [Gammaproteobacteria bacterium]
QRQGIQIGGKSGKAEAPWYVAAKDIQRNVLVVVQGHEHPALYQKTLIVRSIHWINQTPIFPLRAAAKTRYRQPDQSCLIAAIDSGYYSVTFAEPQRAITPGQAIVFYHNDICLGGGIIENE